MHILYVINSGNFGGAEKHVKDLVLGMTQKGHKVYVWCQDGPIVDHFRQAGANVTIEYPKLDICVSYIIKLSKFLEKNQIDVLHSHDLKTGVNSLIAGFYAGTKVRISNVHTPISTWQISLTKKFIDILIYTAAVNLFSTKEIAITKFVKNIKEKEFILKRKIAVIPNYAQIPTYDSNNDKTAEFLVKWGFKDKFVFGCISRLSQEKGQDILIKAFYKLSKEFDDISLALIGGGPLAKKTQQMLNELNLSKKAVITGVFEDNDKASLFKTLNVFVFPSKSEGFGFVPLEALGMQIPVISSDLPVLKEVLGQNVMYFQQNDPISLYEQMKYAYLNYKSIKEQFKDNAWIDQKYGFDKFISSYESLYKENL